MSHQYCNLGDIIYFWFAANDTSGSGADGTSPQFVVREGGNANNAVPVASGTPVLLTNANFPNGCYEIEIDTDGTFSYTEGYTYGIFCTLSVSSQNPTGYVGSFTVGSVPSSPVDGSITSTTVSDSAARKIQGVLGVKNIYTVGAGETYTTISAAEAAATSGDTILVLPGTYTEVNLGISGVTYYLTRGATLDGSSGSPGDHLFDPTIGDFTVLGEGTLRNGYGPIVFTTASSANIYIECDTLGNSGSNATTPAVGANSTSASVSVKARIVSGTTTTKVLVASTGRTYLEADSIYWNAGLTYTSSTPGFTSIRAKYIEAAITTIIGGTAGTVVISGDIVCTSGSSNGLNAPANITVIASSGSVSVPDGRPSLSGSGAFIVSPSFAYNIDASTATGIVPTTGTADAITGGQTYTKSTVDLGTSSTSFTGQSDLSSSDDFFVGGALTFTSGTLQGQTRPITDYVGSLKRFTVYPAFPNTPTSGDGFTIMGYFNLS